ncbi:MAG: acetylxylan esterase, partial [Kiritimatiellae bacterium]|nr:acetylxylan esterase [Kiritimatiellia bacterium]
MRLYISLIMAFMVVSVVQSVASSQLMKNDAIFSAWLQGSAQAIDSDDVYRVVDLPASELPDDLVTKRIWADIDGVMFKQLDGSGSEVESETEMKIFTSNGEVYFRVVCEDDDMAHLVYSSVGVGSPDLWRDDVVEINFEPSSKDKTGVYITLNAGGAFTATGAGFNPKVKKKIEYTKGAWVYEWSCPLQSFIGDDAMQLTWRGNVSRIRQGRDGVIGEDTAWCSTDSLRANVPEKFGWLFFDAVASGTAQSAAPSLLARESLVDDLGCETAMNLLAGKYRAPALFLQEVKETEKNGIDWSRASAISLRPVSEGCLKLEKTEALLLQGKDGFHLKVKSYDSDMKSLVAKKRKRGRGVWLDDSIELFFAAGRQESNDYLHIGVNAEGSIYTGKGRKEHKVDGIKVDVEKSEGDWTVVLFVPFAVFGLKDDVPPLWGCNIVRSRVERPEAVFQSSVWALSGCRTLHNPAKFASLWLAGRGGIDPLGNEGKYIGLGMEINEDIYSTTTLPFITDIFTTKQQRELMLPDMTDRYYDNIRDAQFVARDTEWGKIKAWDAWEIWKKRSRAEFHKSIGAFPAEKCPLKAKVKRVYEDDEIVVENIIYESRPNFYVTATFYSPRYETEKKLPAILRVVGHATSGKRKAVKFGVKAAQDGYAVLVIDTLGQGERVYVNNGWGSETPTSNHYFQGAGATLVGRNLAGYMIYDAIRGIDYLISRPEVDADRIVMTGASGGGTMTSYVAALDDRLFAAAPISAAATSRLARGNYDSEQVLFGEFLYGIDVEGRTACFAPHPLRTITEIRDTDVEAEAIKSYERVRKIYQLKNAGEKVAIQPTTDPHGFGRGHTPKFWEWLNDVMPPNADAPAGDKVKIKVDKDKTYCTKTARSFYTPELEDCETVFSLNEHAINEDSDCEDVVKELRECLAIKEMDFTPLRSKMVSIENVDGLQVEKLVLETEMGIFVPALLLKKEGAENAPSLVLVFVYEYGKEMLLRSRLAEMKQLVDQGYSIFIPDVRAVGETAAGADYSFHGNESSLNGYSYKAATPLIGRRVYDLLACVNYLRSREDVADIHLVGDSLSKPNASHIRQPILLTDKGLQRLGRAESLGGILALLTTALDKDIASCIVNGGFVSYKDFATKPYFYHKIAV